MNFFEQQTLARRHSRWLLLVFVLSALLVAVSVAAAAAALVWLQGSRTLQQAQWAIATAGGVPLALILLGSWLKTVELNGGGGAAVARLMGGRALPQRYLNLAEQRLRNVTEEMAIAAGIPAPALYVLTGDLGINAFAAGLGIADATLTVTQGALEKLSRDELQGLIGHEISHVLNGDMRLNLRLMGVLFGLVMLGQTGSMIRRDRTPWMLVWGGTVRLLGGLGTVMGHAIANAISRKREYLADASAVQFTRQTLGLAGALKKVAVLGAGVEQPQAHEITHMLFASALHGSSHPPLLERIQRLDPSFNATDLDQHSAAWLQSDYCPADLAQPPAPATPLAPLAAAALAAPLSISHTGQPSGDDLFAAQQLAQQLPAPWVALTRSADTAAALIAALLLHHHHPEVAHAQHDILRQQFGPQGLAAVLDMAPRLMSLRPEQRLPLACLAFSTLRSSTANSLQTLANTLTALSEADARISVFEFCTARLMRQLLNLAAQPAAAVPSRRLPQCQTALAQLLALLAQVGNPNHAAHACNAGLHHLFGPSGPSYSPPGPDWPQALHSALDQLLGLAPAGKQLVLEAMVITLGHDGKTTVEEAELLRTVALGLGCPLPAHLGAPN